MLRTTRIVTLLGIVAQVAGFIRTAMIAAALGVSLDVDAYNLSLIAPVFISTVIGGWLQVGFIGRYAGFVATGEDLLATAYRTRMLQLVMACGLLASFICILLPAWVTELLVPPDQVAMRVAATQALEVSGWILFPVVLADFLGLVLNCHGRFFGAAFAPLINGLVSVLALWFWPTFDLSALVWTLLAGSAAQLLVVVFAVRKLALGYPFFDTAVARNEVWTTLVTGLPLLPAILLSNAISPTIQMRVAELGEGAVATYGYAFRLHTALLQVLVMGSSTVLLPHFARLWALADTAEIVSLLRRIARASWLVTACATTGVFLLGGDVVALLLGRGRFDIEHARQVGNVWAILSLALFPMMFGTFIAKLGQAMHRAGAILTSSVISFGVTWLVASLGALSADLQYIAAATAIGTVTVGGFWLHWLGRQVAAKSIRDDLFLAVLKSAILIVPAILFDQAVQAFTDELPSILQLLIRGMFLTIVISTTLFGFRLHQWFFTRVPGKPDRLRAS
jgi:peptidoglycan biosynthesis protein MviN/MurJ (putative lipid II flippase)